ncbi:MAG: glucodextranase DOMON-like domain-containing protein [Chloroflexota bacterium]|nr:glucodextranase DOMON-like domain-containing protein [Chloroflexota bacterium]
MKKNLIPLLNILIILAFLLAACATKTPTETPSIGPESTTEPTEEPEPGEPAEPAEEPIYLSIIWHQHQPVYFKDPETGVYVKPWVRVHASKDYVDMAAMLEEYPEIHATFNLTPSLIDQLDDLEAGAKDLYWVLTEVPADQLSDDQKQFLLDRFFDTNRKVIARFPRYQELLEKRETGEFTNQDYLDLQVLFNLAWTDPDWLAQEPLTSLVAKGENFEEADKKIILDEHQRLIAEVIPIHRRLQDEGQIEVTMTPLTHPILPLLITTDLAKVALPDIEMPAKKFVYGEDAVAQLQLGVELYEDHFGKPPSGMWPAEGSVAQEIVSMVASNGIEWMASDEGVLAKSLGMNSFTRDLNEVVSQPDVLYRPYYVEGRQGGPVAMVFRDIVISDKVGFTYSGLEGELAAKDFINRIHAIREALQESGAEGPHLVSVILDGENAWEHYENDGKEFLHSLYQGLSEDPLIETLIPSEFLAIAPEQPSIENLWAGSWINADFGTWIGEEEENRAWDYLATTREMLGKYLKGIRQAPSEGALEQAQMNMYFAEGSDWFWWYGADQNSGDDESFDRQFRETLKQVYIALGEEPPTFLDVPIIAQQPVSADQSSSGLISPIIDGVVDEGEWDGAGLYLASGGVMTAGQPYFSSLSYGFDAQNLYFLINSEPDYVRPPGKSNVEIYLKIPGGGPLNSFSRAGTLLGFAANRMVAVEMQDGNLIGAEMYAAQGDEEWIAEEETLEAVAMSGDMIELAVPMERFGAIDTGDRINLRTVHNLTAIINDTESLLDDDIIPGSGPALIAVPDLGTVTVLLEIDDPEKDDYGPGTYTYPTDSVFAPGNFDALHFQIGEDEENVVFKISLNGPVDNPWGSPNGLSLQTIDVYIDSDGDGDGGVVLLPGRNLALQAGYAWDYAITAEGWEPGVFIPGAEGPEKIASANEFTILVDPGQQKVTIRVPKAILGDDPASWRYAAVVLGQEGFPSPGVMRVRDVNPSAEQWRFGGAPQGAANHTRVIDLIWSNPGDQEAWLSDFTPSDINQAAITADDMARIAMFSIE